MVSTKKLPAFFFKSASGDEPVRDWLKGLGKEDRQSIGEDIAYVQYKWPIGKPRVDHLRGAYLGGAQQDWQPDSAVFFCC